MTISKRTRFEILRRDDNTCQYCGAKAPDVRLHIDHVMPVALGGSDNPDNLLTACADCNTGKASIAPDSPLVLAVGDRAAAYALGMLDRLTTLRATLEQGREYSRVFLDLWNNWTWADQTAPLPPDYEATLHRMYRMGVPAMSIELAVTKAVSLEWPRGEFGRFSYFCGVIYRQMEESQVGLDYSLTEQTVHTYTKEETEDFGSKEYDKGYDAGFNDGQIFNETFMQRPDYLRMLIDGDTANRDWKEASVAT